APRPPADGAPVAEVVAESEPMPSMGAAEAGSEEDPASLAAAVAWSLLQQGRPEAAESWFRRALEHRPNLESAAEGLAGLLWERGDTREAASLAERFPGNPRLEPYRIGALAERALRAYEGQRWQESLELLEELSRRRPLERQERLRHAWSLYRLGRFEESAQEMEELYREAPGTDDVGMAPPGSVETNAGKRRWAGESSGSRSSKRRIGGSAEAASEEPAALPATAWRRVGEAGSPPPQVAAASEPSPRAEPSPVQEPAATVPSSRLEPPFVPRRTLGARPYSSRDSSSRQVPSRGLASATVGRTDRPASLGQLELTAPPSPEPAPEPGSGWTSDPGPLEERVQAALVLGWSAYRQRQWEAAANWFGRALHLRPDLAEAAHGLVLARLEQGNTWEAEQLARRYQTYPPMMELLGRVLAARGDELAAAGEPAAALDKLEEAALYGALSRGQQITRAWTQYQVGRKASAATLFEQLYREQPDAQSAEGLLYSFKDLGRVPALEQIAAEIPGPQAEWLQQQIATLYAQRKLFLASERARPGRFPELQGVTGPLLAAGWVFHDKTGVPGLGELRLERVPMIARYTWGDVVQLELGVDRLTLDSGQLLPGAEVGSLPAQAAAFVAPPTTRLEDSYVPYLRLQREGWLEPYVELTTTPSNAVLDSTLAGRAGVVYQRPQGNWMGEVYVRPVQESILAYGGLVDPYVGDAWGRVLRRGGKIGGYRQWTRRWGSFLELGTEDIDGEGVAENQRNYLALSVSATTKPRGLDFLAIGPYVFGEENDLNLERFTRGHGGYFSPEEMVETGLAAQFATTEGRPWWLTGRVSLGYHRHIKAQAPFFPLAPDGRFYPREVVTGSALAVELRGLWRLGDSFHLGGGLALNDSPRYDYTSAQIYLAWTPETRAALLSTDLLRRAATFP
ncbi:MAG: cellulose synthase subunit BcsC-related outer membrane protein, partial [Acidobacteriota bacterium]|nr:cellulose synthase subunit BcsC-related outer membrane protein [Acidobacteriota bacterium]